MCLVRFALLLCFSVSLFLCFSLSISLSLSLSLSLALCLSLLFVSLRSLSHTRSGNVYAYPSLLVEFSVAKLRTQTRNSYDIIAVGLDASRNSSSTRRRNLEAPASNSCTPQAVATAGSGRSASVKLTRAQRWEPEAVGSFETNSLWQLRDVPFGI